MNFMCYILIITSISYIITDLRLNMKLLALCIFSLDEVLIGSVINYVA